LLLLDVRVGHNVLRGQRNSRIGHHQGVRRLNIPKRMGRRRRVRRNDGVATGA